MSQQTSLTTDSLVSSQPNLLLQTNAHLENLQMTKKHEETTKVAHKTIKQGHPNGHHHRKKKLGHADNITVGVKDLIPSEIKRKSQKDSELLCKLSSQNHENTDNPSIKSPLCQSDTERQKRNYELMPKDFRYQNFSTPELNKRQQSNLVTFQTDASKFIAAVSAAYSTNQSATDSQINEIKHCHFMMMHSAATILSIAQTGQTIPSGKTKDIKIDFLYDLREILEKSTFATKIIPLLNHANHDLKDHLLINFKDCRHDNRIKVLIPGLDLVVEKGKNYELEKKEKEIKILQHYREVMLELAKNFERIANNYVMSEDELSGVQWKVLKHVETTLSKILQVAHKHDEEGNELRRILDISNFASYKNIIYTSIAKVIKTQVIEILWIKANKRSQTDLIQLRSDQLKNQNQRHALFCSDCLNEFNNFLNNQKYDADFLLGWRRMVSKSSVIYISNEYINDEHKILLEPRSIPMPDEPSDPKQMPQYYQQMQRYYQDLEAYGNESMSLLSEYAFFGDKEYINNFFNAIQKNDEFMNFMSKMALSPEIHSPSELFSHSEEASSEEVLPKDPLEVHAHMFNFLEGLLQPLPDKKILAKLNKELFLTNKETISQLEQKAKENGQECSGAEMTLRFMLQFYGSLNYKYIMEPISNIEELYKLAYSVPNIIKKEPKILPKVGGSDTDKEIVEPARCIYIVLGRAYFEVHSVRVDEINPGPDINETFCHIYTSTSVRKAYPGELASYPNSIEFSYHLASPDTPNRSPEEIQSIKSEMNEKIRLLGLLIDAAGFPSFAERFTKPKLADHYLFKDSKKLS